MRTLKITPKKLEVGDKFKYYVNDNPHHVVSIFNDGEQRLVCYKTYSSLTKTWNYNVVTIEAVLFGICRNLNDDAKKEFVELNGLKMEGMF